MLIPDDILIEILSQLAVKSLQRLRWTCKYWFDLLRNPGFIKMHFYRHQSTTSHLLLIDRTMTRLHGVVSYSVNCSDFIINNNNLSSPPKTVQFDYCNLPVWIDHHTIQANEEKKHLVQFISMGSCNGLICFYSLCGICCHHDAEFEYFLWNPSTREIKKLPPHNKISNAGLHFHGFGYDHTIDDYKVIDILILYGGDVGGAGGVVYPEININIYTLGSNSWSKKVKTNQLGYLARNNTFGLGRDGCFLNGALHWKTSSGILRFDIVEEEEQEQLQQPNYGDDRGSSWFRIYQSNLEVLNGCLCVMNYVEIEPDSDDNDIVELWMMRDYGVYESWTKLFTIDPRKHRNICGRYLNDLKPIELCKDGGILMLFNKRNLVLYDLKNEKHRWVHYIVHKGYEYVRQSYKESLVSLKSGIYLTDAGSTLEVVRRNYSGIEFCWQ